MYEATDPDHARPAFRLVDDEADALAPAHPLWRSFARIKFSLTWARRDPPLRRRIGVIGTEDGLTAVAHIVDEG